MKPLAISLAALLAACASAPPSPALRDAKAFILPGWVLMSAAGCAGERETPVEGGGVIHELYACAGQYSDATCKPWRIEADESLVARCAYAVTTLGRSKTEVRYLRCEATWDQATGCGADNFPWQDLGKTAPALNGSSAR